MHLKKIMYGICIIHYWKTFNYKYKQEKLINLATFSHIYMILLKQWTNFVKKTLTIWRCTRIHPEQFPTFINFLFSIGYINKPNGTEWKSASGSYEEQAT